MPGHGSPTLAATYVTPDWDSDDGHYAPSLIMSHRGGSSLHHHSYASSLIIDHDDPYLSASNVGGFPVIALYCAARICTK